MTLRQTPEDEDAEQAVIDRLLSLWPGSAAIPTWKTSRIDVFFVVGPELRAVVEIKNRPNVRRHPNCKIHVQKIDAVRRYVDFYGVPGRIVIYDREADWMTSLSIPACETAYSDMIAAWPIDPLWGARDRAAREPAYEIPWSDLTEV